MVAGIVYIAAEAEVLPHERGIGSCVAHPGVFQQVKEGFM